MHTVNKLTIDTKCQEMIIYGWKAMAHFPKSEKHGLGLEIRKSMLTVQKLIITACKKYYKKTTLTDLDVEIAILKRLVRVAQELKILSLQKYAIWSEYIVELGKMLGGWIKTEKEKAIKKKQQGDAL